MMNRRQITQFAALGLSAGSGLSLAQAAGKVVAPATIAITPGKDFAVVNPKAPVEAPAGKIEVVEFFWFNCPHCFHFEAMLNPWVAKLPAHVAYRKVPVGFNPSFVPQQKLYYALEGLKLLDTIHPKVFQAVHAERINLSKEEQIMDWMAKQPGVDMAKFKEMYNSFSVANQVKKASQLQLEYDVEGVPAMGVAGQFYTDGGKAGSMPNVLRTVDYLILTQRKKA